jgi:hypothetical protein
MTMTDIYDDIGPTPVHHFSASEMTRDGMRVRGLRYVFSSEPGGGKKEEFTIKIPIGYAWSLIKVIRRLGLDDAIGVAAAGAEIYSGLKNEPFTYGYILLHNSVELAIRTIFLELEDQANRERWERDEDPILSYCYHQLRAKEMTREEAANRASLLLQEKLSSNAWRMRVDRWAADKRRNLPKIGQTKRRKRTEQD